MVLPQGAQIYSLGVNETRCSVNIKVKVQHVGNKQGDQPSNHHPEGRCCSAKCCLIQLWLHLGGINIIVFKTSSFSNIIIIVIHSHFSCSKCQDCLCTMDFTEVPNFLSCRICVTLLFEHFSSLLDSNIGEMTSIFILPLTPKHTDTPCQFSSANGELAQLTVFSQKQFNWKPWLNHAYFRHFVTVYS